LEDSNKNHPCNFLDVFDGLDKFDVESESGSESETESDNERPFIAKKGAGQQKKITYKVAVPTKKVVAKKEPGKKPVAKKVQK
jgi:hypothetical protein